jgi:hypothetical protein
MSFRHIFYQSPVPAEVGECLTNLYQSIFCVPEYFRLYKDAKEANAIAIYSSGSADPDHLIFYTVSGREAIILNEFFEMGNPCLSYLVQVLFDSHPRLHTIHINKFRSKIDGLPFPHEIWEVSQDNVVELPETLSEYRSRLGKRTKANLNNYTNKLRRECPDFSFSVTTAEEIKPDDISTIIDMNRARMKAKKSFSAIDADREEKIIQFAAQYGIVGVISANGCIAAGTICYLVGNHCFADVISHDQAYNRYSIGRICVYLLIQNLIERGIRFFYMGAGEVEYKQKMLSVPQDIYAVSVFRTSINKVFGRLKHMARYGSVKPYLKMIKYNYIWRFKEALSQKIGND